MSDSARTSLTDESFERALLDAGRSEPLPIAGERAWQQFAGSLTTMAGMATTSSQFRSAPARPFLAGTLHSAGLKYGLIGAALGSLITWIWLDARPVAQSTHERTTPLSSFSTPSSVAARGSRSATGIGNDQLGPTPSQPAASTSLRRAPAPTHPAPTLPRAVHEHTEPRHLDSAANDGASSTNRATSTLAAEVAAIDAARAAAQRGDSDDALRRIAQYREEFPAGVLGADADAVAIETLSAAGRSAEAARLAAQFLVSHPNDPHSAAVRQSLRR